MPPQGRPRPGPRAVLLPLLLAALVVWMTPPSSAAATPGSLRSRSRAHTSASTSARLGARSTASAAEDTPAENGLATQAAAAQFLAASLGMAAAAAAAAPSSTEGLPIEATLNTDKLIQHWGYPLEVHTVPTEDGYLLTLQRVPWSKESKEQGGGGPPRPVVVLQHGLLTSSDQWLLRGPGQDLVFLLSDLGYDVWLGNFRGNRYSRRHASISRDSERFWDFSWHENGYYDLAATVDYTLAVAGQPSLYYIGHSMGTTALLVLLSSRPEYNSRIRCATFLAPVAYFNRPRGVLTMAFPIAKRVERELRGMHLELLPHGMLPLSLVAALCSPGSRTFPLCVAGYAHMAGPDPRELNTTLLATALAHLPAGCSLGQLVHFAQVHRTGVFQQYDYGLRGNMARYGRPQPAAYNLSNVVAPVLFHYSSGDYLTHYKDVEKLIGEVPGTAGVYKIPLKEFNHGDYMWGLDTYELLYKTVIKAMQRF